MRIAQGHRFCSLNIHITYLCVCLNKNFLTCVSVQSTYTEILFVSSELRFNPTEQARHNKKNCIQAKKKLFIHILYSTCDFLDLIDSI